MFSEFSLGFSDCFLVFSGVSCFLFFVFLVFFGVSLWFSVVFSWCFLWISWGILRDNFTRNTAEQGVPCGRK